MTLWNSFPGSLIFVGFCDRYLVYLIIELGVVNWWEENVEFYLVMLPCFLGDKMGPQGAIFLH